MLLLNKFRLSRRRDDLFMANRVDYCATLRLFSFPVAATLCDTTLHPNRHTNSCLNNKPSDTSSIEPSEGTIRVLEMVSFSFDELLIIASSAGRLWVGTRVPRTNGNMTSGGRVIQAEGGSGKGNDCHAIEAKVRSACVISSSNLYSVSR